MEGVPGSPAVVSAIVGAVFGAFATNIVRAYFEHRKDARDTKRQLVGELVSFTHEYVAALMELHLARHLESTKEWGNESRKYIARLTKLDGQFMQIDTRVWQAFGRRDVRAGCHRLLNRFKKTREFILQQECPSFKEVEVAFKWIEIQASETGEYAAKEAQINLYDPGGIAFIGFTQSTAMENKRRLSFDDEAPPLDVRCTIRVSG